MSIAHQQLTHYISTTMLLKNNNISYDDLNNDALAVLKQQSYSNIDTDYDELGNGELAVLAKKGDNFAAQLLWDKTYPLINKLFNRQLYRVIKAGYAYEDLCQCSWFVILFAVKQYDPEKGYAFNSYLGRSVLTIVRQLIGNRDYTGNIPVVISLQDPAYNDNSMEKQDLLIDDTAELFVEDIEQNDMEQAVKEAIVALTEKQRTIIYLHFYKNLSFQEIANQLGCSKGNVAQIYYNIMSKLRHYCRDMKKYL